MADFGHYKPVVIPVSNVSTPATSNSALSVVTVILAIILLSALCAIIIICSLLYYHRQPAPQDTDSVAPGDDNLKTVVIADASQTNSKTLMILLTVFLAIVGLGILGSLGAFAGPKCIEMVRSCGPRHIYYQELSKGVDEDCEELHFDSSNVSEDSLD